MLIGYALVSTDDQNPDLQRKALTAAGYAHIVEDHVSGALGDRLGLSRALKTVGAGTCWSSGSSTGSDGPTAVGELNHTRYRSPW